MSRDHTALFLEILNHIKTDVAKTTIFIVRQRIIMVPAVTAVVLVGSVLAFYWLYMDYRYALSEKDAISICDTEFDRIIVLSEPSSIFVVPQTTILTSEVTDFDEIVSEGFYYVYLTYRVEPPQGSTTTNMLLPLDNGTDEVDADADVTAVAGDAVIGDAVTADADVTAVAGDAVIGDAVTADADVTAVAGDADADIYSDARVFCKVSKVSLQAGNKLSRANLETVVVYNQD